MNKTKLYICSAIFTALTALKISVPELSVGIANEMKAVFAQEERQTDTVLALGASLTTGDIFEVFSENDAELDNEEAKAVSKTSAVREPTERLKKLPSLAELKQKMFLQTQKAYASYELPSNVSYDFPALAIEYQSPIDGATSSGFGYRLHPIQNEVKFHYGTDIAAAKGTEIKAFADGTVIAVGYDEGYGNYVVISHENGYRTLYAHCSEVCVTCGSIERGEVIALVGQTGGATGPHLHFELQSDGVYLNPEFYI